MSHETQDIATINKNCSVASGGKTVNIKKVNTLSEREYVTPQNT